MDKDLDTLLASGLLDVPDDFSRQVMLRIHSAPAPTPLPAPEPARGLSWAEKLQSLALIFGGILGLAQLAAFMFGIWTASAAG